MTSTIFKLPFPFETIEVEIRIVDGDIICCPACITSITKPDADTIALATADWKDENLIDNNHLFYVVEHGSFLLLSQISLRETRKSNTFNCNSTFHCRFSKAVAVTHENHGNMPHINQELIPDAVGTTSGHGNNTRCVFHRIIDQLETKKYAYNQNVVNLFRHFELQLPALQMVATTSLQTKLTMNCLEQCYP